MQSRSVLAAMLVTAVAAGVVASGSASAQTKPAKRMIPAPRPVADLALPAAKPAAATSSVPPPLRLTGLVGMTPVGDAAPACRAQCSKDRYTCQAVGDATDCDGRWISCLQACSAR